MITYLTELSNGEEIMTTMEPPSLFEGEETEPQTTTEESEGNFSTLGQIMQFRNAKLSFLYHLNQYGQTCPDFLGQPNFGSNFWVQTG